jgi:hypothetical protein
MLVHGLPVLVAVGRLNLQSQSQEPSLVHGQQQILIHVRAFVVVVMVLLLLLPPSPKLRLLLFADAAEVAGQSRAQTPRATHPRPLPVCFEAPAGNCQWCPWLEWS